MLLPRFVTLDGFSHLEIMVKNSSYLLPVKYFVSLYTEGTRDRVSIQYALAINIG